MTEDDLQRLCDVALQCGDIAAAFDACDSYIRANSLSAKGFRKRAGLHAKQTAFKEAIKDIDEAIRINPHDPSYYFFRGWWNLEMAEFVEAEKDQSIAIKIEGENGTSLVTESAYFFRALARLRMGEFEGSLTDSAQVSDDFLIYLKSFGKVTKADIVKEAISARKI